MLRFSEIKPLFVDLSPSDKSFSFLYVMRRCLSTVYLQTARDFKYFPPSVDKHRLTFNQVRSVDKHPPGPNETRFFLVFFFKNFFFVSLNSSKYMCPMSTTIPR